MGAIETVRARLDAADEQDGRPARLLGAAWDAFSVLVTACRDGADRSAELFAAFSFASAAAARGRLVLWAAPSLPRTCGWGTGDEGGIGQDLEELADALAGLAEILTARLSEAAVRAVDAGDRGACADAAQEAAQVQGLLARGPS